MLPDGYRIILTLYLLEGYDHTEISQILGISESTSKSQYSRAKEKFKNIISKKENMDNLEEYIRKHREEMDMYKPSSCNTEKNQEGIKTRQELRRWISIAAMVAVILGTAVVFFRPGYKIVTENHPERTIIRQL